MDASQCDTTCTNGGEVTYSGLYERRRSYLAKRKLDGRERTRLCRARKKCAAAAESNDMEADDSVVLCSAGAAPSRSLSAYAREGQRFTATSARNIALFTIEQLKGVDVHVRNEVIMKYLSHNLMKDYVPSLLSDLEVVKHSSSIIENMKSGIATHLSGSRKSEFVMAKDILCTLAASENVASSRKVAAVLGVDRRNIRRGIERRIQLDLHMEAFWINYRRTTRSDAISESTRALVVDWWTTETQISPQRKDIIRKLTAVRRVYEEHPTHYLQTSQLEFFTTFKEKNPEAKIQFTKFHALKPWFVRRLVQWNTCCCKYHTELRHLLDGWNEMRMQKDGVHSRCQCTCMEACGQGCSPEGNMCVSATAVYSGLTALWHSVLCSKSENSQWHDTKCLFGTCKHCGVEKQLKLCPVEVSSTQLIKWRTFGREVVGYTEDGKEKTAVKLEYRETTPSELFATLKPALKFFIKHNFLACWQAEEFKRQLEHLPPDTVITCVDFSENYSMLLQNEIQTMHWRKEQVSILVMITYRVNHAHDPCKDDSNLLKDIHYFISDEKDHDNAYVQYAFEVHWDFMKKQGRFPRHHWVWSDGCSVQFKCAKAWYHVAKYPSLTTFSGLPKGCQMTWNFYASGHGKGEVDGAGALCKRDVRKEQVKPFAHELQSAAQIIHFLKAYSAQTHAGYANARKQVHKQYWEVKKADLLRCRVNDVQTINGSRGMHQVRSLSHRDPTLLQYRLLSCTCVSCLLRTTSGECEKKLHVPKWITERLKLGDATRVRQTMADSEEDDIEVGISGEGLSEDAQVGDNIAVSTVDPNKPFWLMLVSKPAHVVSSRFIDSWKCTYDQDDVIIAGYWYEKLQRPGNQASRTYHLRQDKPIAHVHSHVVLTSKFSMPPIVHNVKGTIPAFEITVEVEDLISNALEKIRLLDAE